MSNGNHPKHVDVTATLLKKIIKQYEDEKPFSLFPDPICVGSMYDSHVNEQDPFNVPLNKRR